MILVKQNDKNLKQDIQEGGSFFRSAQAIAELKCQKSLTVHQINAMWDWAVKNGHIENKELVHGAVPIVNKTLVYLGAKERFVELGTLYGKQSEYYKDIPSHLQNTSVLIQKLRCSDNLKYPFHFRVVNNKGLLRFDPHSPQIKTNCIEYAILFAYTNI